jgi:hypothetical protein
MIENNNTQNQHVSIDVKQFFIAGFFIFNCPTGEGVYSARAMLGIDPEDYNLPYRLARPTDSIQTLSDNGVKVFPNPVEDILYIEFEVNFENMQLIIYNMVGQVVSNAELTNQKNQIDINKLKSGMYFYRIIGNNKKAESGKLIKH